MLKKLQENNKELKIVGAAQESRLFRQLDIDATEVVEYAKTVVAAEENSYVPSDSRAESLTAIKKIAREVFAEADIQAGWCCGGGKKMNGMEWHNSSEVIVACTDMLLLLGDFFDIKNDTYDSAKAFGVYLKAGEVIELSPRTLHLAPLKVSQNFKAAIILPKGTNLPLQHGIDGSLRARNKWLLVHCDNKKGILLGGKIGISGKNITVI